MKRNNKSSLHSRKRTGQKRRSYSKNYKKSKNGQKNRKRRNNSSRRKEVSKESLRKQRNLAIALIFLIAVPILSFSIYTMRDITLYFHSDFEDINRYDKIELITDWNSLEVSYNLNNTKYQKLPKSSKLKSVRIYDNITEIQNNITYDLNITETIGFQINQTQSNIEFDNGHNYYNQSDSWNWFNLYYKEFIMDFSFNNIWKNVKNLSISFSFKTNISLDLFRIYFYSFYRSNFRLGYSNSSITSTLDLTLLIDPSCEFLNRSSLNKTNIRVRFLGRETNDPNYLFRILEANVSGYFWKEISEFYYEETNQYKSETDINIINTVEIQENKYILNTLIIIEQNHSFGSWNEFTITYLNTTTTIEEKIHEFSFDKRTDLNFKTLSGLLLLDINIRYIDLKEHFLIVDITTPRWSILL